MPLGFKRRQRPMQRLACHANFRRDVLKMAFYRNAATVDTSPEPQILQNTFSRRTDIPQSHPCPEFL
jgi:hypothetical protein